MTVVYAVTYTVGGYAREDADNAEVGGVYTDKEIALVHARLVHGQIIPVELDVMPPGIVEAAKELGMLK